MICRLCVCDLNEFVTIFEKNGQQAQTPLAIIIAKYLNIEVYEHDTVSNKICNKCCNYLNEFHKFCQFVEEKQLLLRNGLLFIQADSLPSDFMEELPFSQNKDVLDIPLLEQSLTEALLPVTSNTVDEQFGTIGADEDFNFSDQLSELESTLESFTELKEIPHKKNDTLLIPVQDMALDVPKKKSTERLKKDGRKIQCKVCNKLSANEYALKRHMFRNHPSEQELKYPCNLCSKKFAKKFLLDGHLNWHTKDQKKNTCERCNERFQSKQDLKAHRKTIHANDLKIICDSCGRSFKCKEGYENHYAAEHLGITDPKAQCQICNIWLKSAKVLYKHMYIHRDENSVQNFDCPICGVVKKSKAALSRHKSYHHPDKFHKCTYCNKEFKRLYLLEEHIAVHIDQPLYSCCFCPQTFKSSANMYTHLRRIHPHEWMLKKAQTQNVPPTNIINKLSA